MNRPIVSAEDRDNVLRLAIADIQRAELMTTAGDEFHVTHIPKLLTSADESARADP